MQKFYSKYTMILNLDEIAFLNAQDEDTIFFIFKSGHEHNIGGFDGEAYNVCHEIWELIKEENE